MRLAVLKRTYILVFPIQKNSMFVLEGYLFPVTHYGVGTQTPGLDRQAMRHRAYGQGRIGASLRARIRTTTTTPSQSIVRN